MVGSVRNAVASPQLDLSQFGPSYKQNLSKSLYYSCSVRGFDDTIHVIHAVVISISHGSDINMHKIYANVYFMYRRSHREL